MGLVSRYRLDEADVGNDSQGSRNLTNTNAVSVSDTSVGQCTYFDGTANLTLNKNSVHSGMLYDNNRSYSCWFKGPGPSGAIHGNGGPRDTVHRYSARITGASTMMMDLKGGPSFSGYAVLSPDTWHHYASVYDNNTVSLYIDGVLDRSRNVTYLGTFSGHFGIGWDPTRSGVYFTGFLSDFRYYNHAITASNVASFYSAGPNGAFVPSISATLYSHIGSLTWTTAQGASTHTVSQVKDGASEEIIISDTPGLSFTPTGITPGSSYVFNLYTDLDLVTPIATVSTSAPIVSASSVSGMAAHLGNDFRSLSEEVFDSIEPLLRSVFSTGDKVTLSNGENVFIRDSETIEISPGNSFLTPFETTASSGQKVTLINADGSGTNVVEYDENTDQVLVGSTYYPANGSFVVGSYRIVVKKV